MSAFGQILKALQAARAVTRTADELGREPN
jgi:hypothetical protein